MTIHNLPRECKGFIVSILDILEAECMSLNPELKASYEIVLQDLESERQQVQGQLGPLQARLKELHHSIRTLSDKLYPDTPFLFRSPTPIRPPSLKYASISVRWAILDLLSGTPPMTTAEIAEMLKTKGVRTKATNFVNNVSSVLSTTMKEHAEVQQLTDGKWQLSDTGKSAIDHIRTTPRFQRGCA